MKLHKINQTFKINPLYESDGYKVGHKAMLAKGTTRLYGTWIPRTLKYMPGGIKKLMSAGQQMVVRYLHSSFAENFFFTDKRNDAEYDEVDLRGNALKFIKDMSVYLGMTYNGEHFAELWDLGYLPIRIKSLPEGIFTNPNIPHMTFVNTVDGFAWLTLYLETMISKLAWQMPTAATIAHKFRENANFWVQKTDSANLWLTDYMLHDFHSRGGNPFTSIAVGLGHAFSNKGSDTLNVIPAAEYYYDETEMPIFSVNASEHSVSTTKIFTCGEKQMIIDWLKEFPTGILSIVADTFDLWKLITEYLADPEVKALILAREGKLVIRPDSGDPAEIICGKRLSHIAHHGATGSSAEKGVVELLWDIFGGTTSKEGYKVLDSHIGAIYGDSINLERQIDIYERLASKGFASTNIVLGVGSYTYVMLTRDSAGFAAKGSWFEVEEAKPKFAGDTNTEKVAYNIYKDPVTDDGTKKSLKGLVQVNAVPIDNALKDKPDWEIEVKTECTWEEEAGGILVTIYEDGEFFNQTTLSEIRERVLMAN